MAKSYLALKRWLGKMGLRSVYTRRNFKVTTVLCGVIVMFIVYWGGNFSINKIDVMCWDIGFLLSLLIIGRYMLDSCRNILGVLVLTILSPMAICWMYESAKAQPEFWLASGGILFVLGILILIYTDLIVENYTLLKIANVKTFFRIKFYYFKRDLIMNEQEKLWKKKKDVQKFRESLKNAENSWYNKTLQDKKMWIEKIICEEKLVMELVADIRVVVDSDLSNEDPYLFIRENRNKKTWVLEYNANILNCVSLEEVLLFSLQSLIDIKTYSEFCISQEEETSESEYMENSLKKECVRQFKGENKTLAYDCLFGYYAKNKSCFYLYE